MQIVLLDVSRVPSCCLPHAPRQSECRDQAGGTAYFIKCGSARVDACYQKASNVCPNGYTFADRQANPDANTMLVECKP